MKRFAVALILISTVFLSSGVSGAGTAFETGFETGSLSSDWVYSVDKGGTYQVVQNSSLSGSYVLELNSNGNNGQNFLSYQGGSVPTSDYVVKSDVVLQHSNAQTGVSARVGSTGGYTAWIDSDNSDFILAKQSDANGFTKIKTVSQSYSTGSNYSLEIKVDGSSIDVFLYDSSGTQLQSLSTTDSAYSSGYPGYQWADWVTGDQIMDSFQVCEIDGCVNSDNSPSLSNFEPADGATGVSTDVQLNATVTDPDNSTIQNVTFYNASDDSVLGYSESVSNNTVASTQLNGLTNNKKFVYYVEADDGVSITKSSNISFTTETSQTYSAEVLDGFEDQDIAEYSGSTGGFSVASDNVYNGSYNLEASSVSGWGSIYASNPPDWDLSNLTNISTYIHYNGDVNRGGVGFASSNNGSGYFAFFDPGSNEELRLVKLSDYQTGATDIATKKNVILSNGWYRLVLEKDAGSYTAYIFDVSDGVLAAQTSGSDSNYSVDTYSLSAYSTAADFDTVERSVMQTRDFSLTLKSPSDSERFFTSSKGVDFNWSMTSAEGAELENTTLYGNFSGSWSEETSFTLSGTDSSKNYSKLLDNGTYKWGVVVYDNQSQKLSENRTFTIGERPPQLNVVEMSDWHVGNLETDPGYEDPAGTADDIIETVDWIQGYNPDAIFDMGDLVAGFTNANGLTPSQQFSLYWSNISEIESTTGVSDVKTMLGNHDGYHFDSAPGWSGMEGFFRKGNYTSADYSLSKGNIKQIVTSPLNYQTDYGSWSNFLTSSSEGNNHYFIIPMHRRPWLENELQEGCQNDKNVMLRLHDPLYHTSIYSNDWWGMKDQVWQNSSAFVKNTIDSLPSSCQVTVFNGHVHKDPDAYYSGDPNVAGGNIVWGEASSVMPDNMLSVSMTTVSHEHGPDDVKSVVPSIYTYNITEGRSSFDLYAYDTENNQSMGITYNDTSSTKSYLNIPLSYEVDLGNNPSSDDWNWSQEWNPSQFSDESDNTQWYNHSEGFWPKREGWIISRWKYNKPRSFNELNVSKTSGLSLDHEFRVTNNSETLDEWSQWYSDPSNAPKASAWSVNTSFNGSSDKYIYDMELKSVHRIRCIRLYRFNASKHYR